MKSHEHLGKTLNASVDWITCTGASQKSQEHLWWIGDRVSRAGEQEGERATRWHGHGYAGWSSAGVAFGKRTDGVILRLSGPQAAKEWSEAATACENLSRLDLAVDHELDPPVTKLAAQVYADAGHVPSQNGRPPKRTLITSSDGGVTVYLGARVSENFGRLYDKGIEQKARSAGSWWRWEVECKGSVAQSVASGLLSAKDATMTLHRFVAQWFARRSGHSFKTTAGVEIYNLLRKRSDDERRLEWLSRGVRPTVVELIERVGRERVLFALGIPPEKPQLTSATTQFPLRGA